MFSCSSEGEGESRFRWGNVGAFDCFGRSRSVSNRWSDANGGRLPTRVYLLLDSIPADDSSSRLSRNARNAIRRASLTAPTTFTDAYAWVRDSVAPFDPYMSMHGQSPCPQT